MAVPINKSSPNIKNAPATTIILYAAFTLFRFFVLLYAASPAANVTYRRPNPQKIIANKNDVQEEITSHLEVIDALVNPTIFSEKVKEITNTVVIKVRNCLHMSLVSG